MIKTSHDFLLTSGLNLAFFFVVRKFGTFSKVQFVLAEAKV